MTLYLYASHGSPERVIVVLSSALLIIVPADILRINCSRFERSYEKVVGFLMRESEKVRHVPPIIMSLPNRTSFDIFHSYLQKQTNGVIWYILGVLFVLSQYPLDIAVISIMMCVNIHLTVLPCYTLLHLNSLSWADTAASTFGRLWGRHTPPLPSRVPILGLPLAPRKSLAGFLAASITGAAIVFSFWSWLVPAVGGAGPAWDWAGGVSGPGIDHSPMGQSVKAVLRDAGVSGLPTGGWVGLAVISIVSGLVTGIAEALGVSSFLHSLL